MTSDELWIFFLIFENNISMKRRTEENAHNKIRWNIDTGDVYSSKKGDYSKWKGTFIPLGTVVLRKYCT